MRSTEVRSDLAASEPCEALSVADAAKLMTVGVPTLRKMIARREIPHCRLGRRIALLADDIRDYLAAHRIPAS